MSNEDEAQRKPYRIVEEKIPFLERVSLAIQVFISSILVVLSATLLMPVNCLRALFTTKRRVIDVIEFHTGHSPEGSNPDDGEDWKRAHREQYGEE